MSITISNYSTPSLPPATASARTASATDETAPVATDKVTLQGQSPDPVTYANPRSGTAQAPDLASMLEESSRKAQAIIDLIVPLVKQQGLSMAKVVSGEQQLTVDAATIAKAKAAIAEDGEFGVKQVAERILSFARMAVGGDPSRLDAIRAAVEKGFKEAADMLGGTLPEISQKTHEVIVAEFDRWQSDGIPEGDTISLPAEEEESEAQQ
ncbi:MAG TPA: hypothetical protein VI140_09645 [Oxalicibacterium sp.]